MSTNGGARWNKDWVNVLNSCVAKYVGLEEIGYCVWNVYRGDIKFYQLHERPMRIESGLAPTSVSKYALF